jgi:GTPase SAR1 family protein
MELSENTEQYTIKKWDVKNDNSIKPIKISNKTNGIRSLSEQVVSMIQEEKSNDVNNTTLINDKQKDTCLRMIVVGPSNSGKTYFVSHLGAQYLYKRYEIIIIICSSDDTRAQYGKAFKTVQLFKQPSKELFTKINDFQTKLQDSGKQLMNVLIVYDDNFTRANKNDADVFNNAIAGRHLCISYILVMHDLVLTDRVVRDQCTHLILTRQLTYSILENIAIQYLLGVARCDSRLCPTLKTSNAAVTRYITQLMHKGAEDHNVIVITPENYKKVKNSTFDDIFRNYKA